jgi:hypothetical protein
MMNPLSFSLPASPTLIPPSDERLTRVFQERLTSTLAVSLTALPDRECLSDSSTQTKYLHTTVIALARERNSHLSAKQNIYFLGGNCISKGEELTSLCPKKELRGFSGLTGSV